MLALFFPICLLAIFMYSVIAMLGMSRVSLCIFAVKCLSFSLSSGVGGKVC